MSVFCGCVTTGANGNTGRSNAELEQAQSYGYFLFNRFDDEGNQNMILDTDFVNGVLPADYINQKINEADASKRWYPLQDFKATTNERADPNTETPTGGNNQITDLGVRALTAQIWGVSPKYKRNLDKLACKELVVIYIDDCGSLWGKVTESAPTQFKGFRVANKTFEARWIPAVEGVVAKIQINFEIDQVEKDGDLCGIPASALGTDLLDVQGLLNAKPTISSISTTGFVAQIDLEYGGFTKEKGVTGLLAADFLLYNNTSDAAVTITTVTESTSTEGQYTFVIPAQTSADNLTLSGSIVSGGDLDGSYTKQGFEIVATSFDIP